MKIKDYRNQQYVILNNGNVFQVGKSKTIKLPRRLVLQLKRLYSGYYNWFKEQGSYLRGHDGLYTIQFHDFNSKSKTSITIKHQASFEESEEPIKKLISYITIYL